MKKTRNGLMAIALVATALAGTSARALVAHGYEAHIGHPHLHFSALIAFCLACLVGGMALVILGTLAVAGVFRKRRQDVAEPAG